MLNSIMLNTKKIYIKSRVQTVISSTNTDYQLFTIFKPSANRHASVNVFEYQSFIRQGAKRFAFCHKISLSL